MDSKVLGLRLMRNSSPLNNPHNPDKRWRSGVIADGENSQFDIQ
jgi:hypothetical protein